MKTTVFKSVNRLILTIAVSAIYILLMQIFIFAAKWAWGPEVITPGLYKFLWVIVFAGVLWSWATGHVVDDDKEGVPRFFDRPLSLFSLGKGRNPLPPFFSVAEVVTTWTTLSIPKNYSDTDQGFTVTSSDKLTMLARANVPYRINDAFLSLTAYESDGVLTQIRDATVQVIRDLAGNVFSDTLQKGAEVTLNDPEMPEEVKTPFQGQTKVPMEQYFRKNLERKIAAIIEGYPIEINYAAITVPKFLPSKEVQTQQEGARIEKAQKEKEEIEQAHIQNLIKGRTAFYMSVEGGKLDAKTAVLLARQEILSSLNKVPHRTVSINGGSDWERGMAVNASLNPGGGTNAPVPGTTI